MTVALTVHLRLTIKDWFFSRVFLGFTNLYRRFIEEFSRIAASLISILKTSSTESAERKKSEVGVGGDGRNKAELVGKYELDGGDSNGAGAGGKLVEKSSKI